MNDEKDLDVQVGTWLRQRGLKLVTAESCTGGLIGHRLTNVPGSSEYYLGGVVSYANEAKEQLLGVRPETLRQYGAVSAEVAKEMAFGARRLLSQKFSMEQLIGISVSGVAGPGGGSAEKPVGLVWIGLSAPGLDRAWKHIWQGNRKENKELSAQQALQILLDFLQGSEGSWMKMEPSQVVAHWASDGRFEPSQFSCQGVVYQVESTGRSWEDETGIHVLCMVYGGQVFELVFRLQPAGWLVRLPVEGPRLA